MKRTVNVVAIYKTKDICKNLERFANKYPEVADYCKFGDLIIEDFKNALPITDKYLADGTVNNDWTYYFDIDFNQEGMYIWFVKRV